MTRIIIASVLFVFFGCSQKEETPIKSDHIKFFGFALVDTYWDDPRDNIEFTNYSHEVNSFCNLADILVVTPSDDITARVEQMHDLGMRSYFHINELFYERVDDIAPSGHNYDLRADYQQRWQTFIELNADMLAHNPIWYLGEEPTWNGISADELQSAADLIKSSLPQTVIMIVEAYPALDDLVVPSSVDWVGFDRYFVADPSGDRAYGRDLAKLKSKLSTEQKIVIIMDTHHIQSIHQDQASIELDEMEQVAQSYYELALSEEQVIAIIGYFWPSGFDNPSSTGARAMPTNVMQKYQEIGQRITGK